jgi:small subunit ribosomal protein S6e
MAKFKVIVSDPSAGKSKVVELDGAHAVPLIGRRLGESVDGSVVGMPGLKLQVTGGSDRDGFPMRPNIHGGVRVSVIVSKSVGFHPKREGERRRKTLRGNVLTEDIVQVNMKILERPKKAEKPRKERKAKGEAGEPEKEVKEAETESEHSRKGESSPSPAPVSGGESSEKVAQATGS